ncbi:MAG: TlyA family RNA methyltransferase [Magnetococcus sp. WYHC-3]
MPKGWPNACVSFMVADSPAQGGGKGGGKGGGRDHKRQRLDERLVSEGLAPDLDRAQRLILAGLVLVDDRPGDKAGTLVAAEAVLRLRAEARRRWVSRGADKLQAGLDHWQVAASGRVCLDLGASTGGFTQLLLERGAARVYAVDVGYGQLAWSLTRDPRVVVLERTHAAALGPAQIPEAIALLTADLSFISLTRVLPAVWPLLAPGAEGVVLVKPQFEAPREQVHTGGVVRDPEQRQRAAQRVGDCLTALGAHVGGWMDSPLTGPAGNRELLLYFQVPSLAGDPGDP